MQQHPLSITPKDYREANDKMELKLVDVMDKVITFDKSLFYSQARELKMGMYGNRNPLIIYGTSSLESWLELRTFYVWLITIESSKNNLFSKLYHGFGELATKYNAMLTDIREYYGMKRFIYDLGLAVFATIPHYKLAFTVPVAYDNLLEKDNLFLRPEVYEEFAPFDVSMEKIIETLPEYEYFKSSPLLMGRVKRFYFKRDFTRVKFQEMMHLVPNRDLIEVYQEFLHVRKKFMNCVYDTGRENDTKEIRRLMDKTILDAIVVNRIVKEELENGI